jgi:plastocyanin
VTNFPSRRPDARRAAVRRGALGCALAAALAVAAAPSAVAAPLVVAVLDAAGRPVEDAVVTVLVPGTPARAPHGTVAEIGQRERQFVPRVSAVQVGTSIAFPNHDTVRHHVYSFSPAKTFELKLYVGTPPVPVTFDKAGVVAIGCNIHDKMQAWIAVVETPHAAVTDAAGLARFDVPSGEHRVRAFRPADGENAAVAERLARTGLAAPQPLKLPAAPAP